MRIIPLFCLSAALLCSCKKNQPKDPFSYESLKEKDAGTASATINGSVWKSNLVFAKVNPNSPSGKLLIEATYYENGLRRQSLALNFINPTIKQQPIYSNRVITWGDNYTQRPLDSLTGGFYLVMQDVGENSYDIVSSEENLLTIDSYNPSTSELSGSYKMTLYRLNASKKSQTQSFPDTLRITNGSFNVKYTQ